MTSDPHTREKKERKTLHRFSSHSSRKQASSSTPSSVRVAAGCQCHMSCTLHLSGAPCSPRTFHSSFSGIRVPMSSSATLQDHSGKGNDRGAHTQTEALRGQISKEWNGKEGIQQRRAQTAQQKQGKGITTTTKRSQEGMEKRKERSHRQRVKNNREWKRKSGAAHHREKEGKETDQGARTSARTEESGTGG